MGAAYLCIPPASVVENIFADGKSFTSKIVKEKVSGTLDSEYTTLKEVDIGFTPTLWYLSHWTNYGTSMGLRLIIYDPSSKYEAYYKGNAYGGITLYGSITGSVYSIIGHMSGENSATIEDKTITAVFLR